MATSLAKLKAVNSISELADLLKYKASALAFLLHKLPAQQKYSTFSIPKKSGGVRTIQAPEERLKLLQRRVANLLNDCLVEIEKDLPSPAHGFKPDRSIFTNAAAHLGRRYVFNVDLEDFFPSIHFGRVFGLLQKSDHFSLQPMIARSLANIVCHEAKLPQGAPSSPVVSNLIARMLDVQLARLAKLNKLTYSRYADDLTFSTNSPSFPQGVGIRLDEHKWVAGDALIATVKKCGFKINDKKTRMAYRSSRQEVTGLVVNDCVSVPVDYRRWARASVSRLIAKGAYFDPPAKSFVGPPPENPAPASLPRLEGVLSFIYSSHKFRRLRLVEANAPKEIAYQFHSDEIVYRRFLYYTKLFLAEQATVVCEGKTDSVYLKHATRLLANSFPSLADNLKFIKHNDISSRVLNLNGGTDVLKHFCSNYCDHSKKFHGGSPTNPVLVVVDRDKAGGDVINYGKGIAKNQGVASPHLPDLEFFLPNVYVIRIPAVPGMNDVVIENLFSAKLLATELNGKKLNITNKKVGSDEF